MAKRSVLPRHNLGIWMEGPPLLTYCKAATSISHPSYYFAETPLKIDFPRITHAICDTRIRGIFVFAPHSAIYEVRLGMFVAREDERRRCARSLTTCSRLSSDTLRITCPSSKRSAPTRRGRLEKSSSRRPGLPIPARSQSASPTWRVAASYVSISPSVVVPRERFTNSPTTSRSLPYAFCGAG
jgi:hypothetical protein